MSHPRESGDPDIGDLTGGLRIGPGGEPFMVGCADSLYALEMRGQTGASAAHGSGKWEADARNSTLSS